MAMMSCGAIFGIGKASTPDGNVHGIRSLDSVQIASIEHNVIIARQNDVTL